MGSMALVAHCDESNECGRQATTRKSACVSPPTAEVFRLGCTRGGHIVDPILEDRLRYCQTLPTLSTVALQVLDLAKDPAIDFAAVARCISHDPGLAAKVLRVANTAFYGNRRHCNNLRQALTQIGLDNAVSLALGFSLKLSLAVSPQCVLDHNYFWRRAILCATSARALGQAVGVSRQEDLFLGGLLQDAGMLILDSITGEQYGNIANGKAHVDLADIERQILGTDHIEVGTWILTQWQLPEYLMQLVRFSHAPSAPDIPQNLKEMSHCVYASGAVADCWLHEASEPTIRQASIICQEWLDLDRTAFHDVMESIAKLLPGMSAFLEIPALAPGQIEGILEQAKELLVLRTLHLIAEVQEVKSDAAALKSRTQALETRATMDCLTGLYNRSWLEEHLAKEFARAREHDVPLSIAFVDLDRFKKINDTHGHLVGDEVLRSIAQILTENLRQSDRIARYGGEEFVVILPGVGSQAASVALKRFLDALRNYENVSSTVSSIRVTASIGLATYGGPGIPVKTVDSAVDLLRAADRALYAAKRRGRDTMVIYETDN